MVKHCARVVAISFVCILAQSGDRVFALCCQLTPSMCSDTESGIMCTNQSGRPMEWKFCNDATGLCEVVGRGCNDLCTGTATSPPLIALPTVVTVAIGSGSSCTVTAPVRGATGFALFEPYGFNGEQALDIVSGSVRVRVEPTADPQVAVVKFIDLTRLTQSPFQWNNHTVQFLETRVVSGRAELALNLLTDNLTGALQLENDLEIDGVPFTMHEDLELVGSVNAQTGSWSPIRAAGLLFFPANTPALSVWGMSALLLALLLAGVLMLRYRHSHSMP